MSEASDRVVFGDQIRLHGKLFYHVAIKILRDAHLAEEACQQALCRAWQKRASLNDPAAIRAWLVRTIVHESLGMLRQAQGEKKALDGKADRLVAGLPDREDAAGFEQRESVLAAVAALPDPLRVVVVLRMLHGMSGNETAEILRLSPAEISRRLYGGMEMLRSTLSSYSAESEIKR